MTKCDKVEWGKKCHYASDILYIWLHAYFVILLSYNVFWERKWLLLQKNLATILHLNSKSYYISGTKVFWQRCTEIYRNLHSKCFKNVVLGHQEMVHWKYFFLHQTEICCWKIYKVRSRSILFSMSRDLRFAKWVRFFERKYIVKWVIFFTSFY